MGVKALRKIQLGKETTAGTAVAATQLWLGTGVMSDDREVVWREDDIGYLSGVDNTYISKLSASLSMESTPATFEQLPYILEAGVKQVNTGAADGTGSGKVYAYPFPTTSANTIRTFTIEAGDDQQAEEMEYAFVTGFVLEGAGGDVWKMSADWMGRQVTNTTFTGAISLPSAEEMLFGKSKLYIDEVSGTAGTTQITNSLLAATLTVETGWDVKYTADGTLYWSFNYNKGPQVELQVTFEHDANATGQKTAWRNETAKQLRLLVEGSTLTTAGTAYSVKTVIIDLAGKWAGFDPIGEQNGNDILVGTFIAKYNNTASAFATITVVNEDTTIT